MREHPLPMRGSEPECEVSAFEEVELQVSDSGVVSSLSSSMAVVVVLKVEARDGARVVGDAVGGMVLYESDVLRPY